MNKILRDTSELLGIPAEVSDFDNQLIMYINMAFTTLNEIGFGEPYQVTAERGDLEEYLPNDAEARSLVQIYIFTKVRALFDPPSSSFVLAALQGIIAEHEFRLSVYELTPPSTT